MMLHKTDLLVAFVVDHQSGNIVHHPGNSTCKYQSIRRFITQWYHP